MARKREKRKSVWVTRLRVQMAKEYGLTGKPFDAAKRDYEGLTLKTFLKKALPPDLAELEGPNGEVAYVRNDSNYWEPNKHTLVLEMPLSLRAAQKREALRQADNFFERFEIADQEAFLWERTSSASEENLIKKPLLEWAIPARDLFPDTVSEQSGITSLRNPMGAAPHSRRL